MALAALLAGCPDEENLLKRKRTASGDYITRVRGIQGHEAVPALEAAARPLGSGAKARIIVQPLTARMTEGRFIWALYVSSPSEVATVLQAIKEAKPAPHRTCKPEWRLDLRYGHHEHVARIHVACQRLDVDGRSLAFDGKVAELIRPYLRRAARSPDHKILRVRVPVEHEPRRVLAALAHRAIEAHLPQDPPPRGPVVRMSYAMLERPPADPTKLDAAARGMRKKAYRRLGAYARQIRIGHHEVAAVKGPRPAYERFRDTLFEAKYEVMVIFKHGTLDHQLGFLGLGNNFVVEEITRPDHYRVDLVFSKKERYRKMRKVISHVPLDPKLSVY